MSIEMKELDEEIGSQWYRTGRRTGERPVSVALGKVNRPEVSKENVTTHWYEPATLGGGASDTQRIYLIAAVVKSPAGMFLLRHFVSFEDLFDESMVISAFVGGLTTVADLIRDGRAEVSATC
jgi:hypothetical protein